MAAPPLWPGVGPSRVAEASFLAEGLGRRGFWVKVLGIWGVYGIWDVGI